MSAIPLAELLDQLHADEAYVREAEDYVLASGLTTEATILVIQKCKELSWGFELFDSAGTEWHDEILLDDFSPYRVKIRKPATESNNLVLLTNTGFAEWLKNGHTSVIWQVARLNHRIVTHARTFQPWGEVKEYQPSPNTKSPRALVREFGQVRCVPEDVRPWLLREDIEQSSVDETTKVWIASSSITLLYCLANEIEPEANELKFNGPPKLSISLPIETISLQNGLPISHFKDLQHAANWVFENEREAELRHGLMAHDIARSAGGHGDSFQHFLETIASSLNAAKVAYQVSLSDVGRDTLKMLADLRKAVTEETAKVTDATRQLVTSVAGALAVSLGLIAARINAAANYELIVAVMIVVAAYLGVVIYSGYGFIRLQRQLRSDWQSRLYRFLPLPEYETMVSKPANQAERTFFNVAWGGSLGIFVLTVIVIFGWRDGEASIKSQELPEISAHETSEAISTTGDFSLTREEASNPHPKPLILFLCKKCTTDTTHHNIEDQDDITPEQDDSNG